MTKKKEITNEDLAAMVQRGFSEMKDYVDKGFYTLGQGQEDIKLRLDNVAYRFELKDLEKRVKKLELKLGPKT